MTTLASSCRSVLPWWRVRLLLLVLGAGGLVPATGAELSGTRDSLTYRGPATSVEQPRPGGRLRIGPGMLELPGQAGGRVPRGELRLVLAGSGREVARARYDSRLEGYFFVMPTQFTVESGPMCLALRGIDGRTLPLRSESAGDDGYEFRHGPWEDALRAKANLGGLEAELARLRLRQAQEEGERHELHRLLGMAEGEAAPACQLGAAQPEPARPAWALPESAAAEVAHALCLASLSRTLGERGGVLAARATELVAATGLPRPAGAIDPALSAPAELTVVSADLAELLTRGVQAGRRSLEFEQGLEGLRAAHGACARGVRQVAADERQRWTAAREAAANAPQIAKATCEQRRQRLEQLQDARAKGAAYQQALETRLQAARAAQNDGHEVQRLEQARCNAR